MNVLKFIKKAREKPMRYIIWKVCHLIELRWKRRKYKDFKRYYSFNAFCRECGFNVNQSDILAKYFLFDNNFRFYRKWDSHKDIADDVLTRYPESIDGVVHCANDICNHIFDLLGSGPVNLGDKINWYCDFKTGRCWPPKYYTDIDYNNLDEPSDVKVVWELTRFQHFIVLGKAYLYTKDEKYAREFINQWEDFVRHNPVAMSVNWACTMDVALRAISWIWSYHFFKESPSFNYVLQARFIYDLTCHGKFIYRNLEYSDVNGNHYLSDGAGLIFLGLFLNKVREAGNWLEKGKEIIFGEIEKQVSADGVDFEKSIPYHRLVMELFLDSILLLKANGHEIPPKVLSRIEKMGEFTMAYIKPNGDIPLIGDADDGRMHILGQQGINDHRYLLSTCAVLFKRPDFKAAAGCMWEESYWKLDDIGLAIFDNIPDSLQDNSSKAYFDGGFFIIKNEIDYMIIDCGDIGLAGRGGHGHNDMLGFELFSRGVTWFTDSGAFLYTASPHWRNKFRSSRFHNVLVIDGEEISRLGESLWNIINDAKPVFKLFDEQDDFVVFVGGHTGYLRLREPVMHYRGYLYLKNRGLWIVIDKIEGKGEHEVERLHQLSPGIKSNIFSAESVSLLTCKDKKLLMWSNTGKWREEETYVSYSYGKKDKSSRIVIKDMINGPAKLITVFSVIDSQRDLTEYKQQLLKEINPWINVVNKAMTLD